MAYGPILIVDDDPINLATLNQILKDDYSLVFARSGHQALQLVAKHQPSLILLDIQMPTMDGYQVCRTLKSDAYTEAIPVIFVSALSELGNEKAGFEVGCVDYLIKPVTADIVKARVKTHLSLVKVSQLQQSQRDAIFMLGEAGHFKDNDTGLHIWRMAAFAKLLAKTGNWPEQDCELLEMAAAMHDTGKIGIPNAILQKPGALSAEEWQIMKTHSQIGYNILNKSQAPLFKLAAEVALYHHEKWDGSGYPKGLAAKNIPESARMVAIADVFDALSMKRSYKEPWPLPQILSHMQAHSGLHFDPELLSRFVSILPEVLEVKAHWDDREEV